MHGCPFSGWHSNDNDHWFSRLTTYDKEQCPQTSLSDGTKILKASSKEIKTPGINCFQRACASFCLTMRTQGVNMSLAYSRHVMIVNANDDTKVLVNLPIQWSAARKPWQVWLRRLPLKRADLFWLHPLLMSTDCCLTQVYYTWKEPDVWPCENGRAPHYPSDTSETELSHQFLPLSKQYTPLLEIKQLFSISLSILTAVLRESQLHKTHLAQQRGSLYCTSSTAHTLHDLT